MDKLELPILHPLTTGSVDTTLETLPDSTTRPVSSDPPHIPPSPEEEEEEEEEAEQEVVDLETSQPCVVDLTHEDEDDVDVVAVVPREQSIIYLGTEQRRGNQRRRNTNSTVPPAALEDLTRPEQQEQSIFETDGGGGGGNTREEEAIVLGGERQPNNWLMEAQSIDFQNPNLVFGNLLDDYPLEAPESHVPRRHNPLRDFRPVFRRHGSRSRSPQIPDYTREVTRTPEIVQDVHEMQSEVEGRRPPSIFNITQVPLVHNAVQAVNREHIQKVAQVTAPLPPPSPPPREQPIISCLVCLDSAGTIKETSRTLCSTVCGHVFCSTCLEESVKRKKQCPVCRKKLTKKQYHPLFI